MMLEMLSHLKIEPFLKASDDTISSSSSSGCLILGGDNGGEDSKLNLGSSVITATPANPSSSFSLGSSCSVKTLELVVTTGTSKFVEKVLVLKTVVTPSLITVLLLPKIDR